MKPILFSTPMVQAILAGRKTQTRRVIKPQYAERPSGEKIALDALFTEMGPDGTALFAPHQPGDILWVRETWANISDWVDVDPAVGIFDGYIYKADQGMAEHPKWRPSIFMPREAARIFLRVTGVRVERICQITHADCCAEGIFDANELKNCFDGSVATDRYRELWNTLYAERGYSWESNPWVWVYEFESIEKPEG